MGGKLPLSYYNLVNEDVARNDVPKEKDYGQIPGVNQDVPNPSAINRPLAWPIRVKTSICSDIRVLTNEYNRMKDYCQALAPNP